ncbi:ABC transporter substrate-binding protein [Niabella drilacis]|uniref:Peptide/nickel transport system substrate-binding protein n=1 Tax=Niabella drilacis (strain DSM 25811 / CCM 8410 / CCUG 62505 / LMG 26954 / E90) TaxID=1285928 RepID=A0A1G6IUV9_NIADE|nr:ABC transporter substrate-binding protein [Niabella drilacis]SDC10289.1 peptide/nickel transport system substrate-binding protein [Niabella drilacis]
MKTRLLYWMHKVFKWPYDRVVALLLLVIPFAGCTDHAEKERKVFRYNEYTGIASLDPAFAKNQSTMWPAHQLFNTLVEIDDSLNIKPSLATRWEVSEDKRTYTFYLRSDVLFHDNPVFPGSKGRNMTAADVVFSLNRIIDPGVASPGAWIFNGKVDPREPFTAVNDTVFRLKLLQPYQPILGILSMQYCSVVAREAVQQFGVDFRSHPVGTGPFQFVAWEEGQGLVFKKNPNYFERDSAGNRLPYIDGIKISFKESRATEFLLLRQGNLDFINELDPSFKDEVLTKKGVLKKAWEGKLVLKTQPYLNIEYLGILVDSANEIVRSSPLRFKKVRQAINYGFDRRKMILYLRNSLGTPAESGFVPKGLPSFNDSLVKGYHYDPAKAIALLKEAGFPGGKGLPVIRLLTISMYADFANFIAKQLEAVGMRIQVEVVQKALLFEMTANSRAAFFRGGWIADYPDAENYLSVFYSKNPAPPNYTRYKNARFDAIFEAAIKETNDSLRYILYRQADQLAINDAPVVPLWYDKVIQLVQPNIKGYQPNALNLLELRRVQILDR